MVVNKSKAAFRTIAEVADELGIATHVLRFWETKFPQIKPMKRSGGRRYYRPDDVKLVSIIEEIQKDFFEVPEEPLNEQTQEFLSSLQQQLKKMRQELSEAIEKI